MRQYSGAGHVAVIFIVFTIGCAVSIVFTLFRIFTIGCAVWPVSIVATSVAVAIGGRGILIKRDMW